MALSPQQRRELGLDLDPTPIPLAGEYVQAPSGQVVKREPTNMRLILSPEDKATAPKIRQMVNELLAGNVDNVNFWLAQVGAANPKVAVELFIELAQFSLPKLKALAVAIDDRSDNPKAMTFQQLQAALLSDD